MADETSSSNVRSIQGEQQGELMPNRRAKFKGMSVNELAKPLPYGGEVTLTVKGTVVGEGREKRKDGVEVMTSTIVVGDVKITNVEEPEDEQPSFDDVMQG